jgi:glycosyltransferase involved in cell wall biosynthesis
VRLCFIVDGNSIHARRWIEHFCTPDNEVHIVSTTYCAKPPAGATVHNLAKGRGGNVPTDALGAKAEPTGEAAAPGRKRRFLLRKLMPQQIKDSTFFQHRILMPYDIYAMAARAKRIVADICPDLVHALRLPIEGWIAGLIGYRPLAITTFGNDMVYFAEKYRLCRWLTKKAMSISELYFADSLRDRYIAEVYGFSPWSRTLLTPVTGGLKLDLFPMEKRSPALEKEARRRLQLGEEDNLIISVRGFRSFYNHAEVVIEALPQVLDEFPNTTVILKGDMRQNAFGEVQALARRLHVERHIRFTDRLCTEDLQDYFLASDLMLSAALYDGCPVSMLEGMAYGLIPVMSNHTPIQEWVSDGSTGYLFDAEDPVSAAQAVQRALRNRENWGRIRARNWDQIRARADARTIMPEAERLYHALCS